MTPKEGARTVAGGGEAVRGITFWCPDCGRHVMVARTNLDPPAAVRARLQCDRCDDGDFHSPEYEDGAGAWVDPVAHLEVQP